MKLNTIRFVLYAKVIINDPDRRVNFILMLQERFTTLHTTPQCRLSIRNLRQKAKNILNGQRYYAIAIAMVNHRHQVLHQSIDYNYWRKKRKIYFQSWENCSWKANFTETWNKKEITFWMFSSTKKPRSFLIFSFSALNLFRKLEFQEDLKVQKWIRHGTGMKRRVKRW